MTRGFQKEHVPWNKGLSKDNNESLKKLSLSLKGRCPSLANRLSNSRAQSVRKAKLGKKIINTGKYLDRWSDFEERKKQSDRLKEYYKRTPERLKILSDEARTRLSFLWKDKDFVNKVTQNRNAAQRLSPNNSEIYLLKILDKCLPGKYFYVGDGSLSVGRKCPDFWNGDNKLIELYGDYWHKGEDEQDKINYFAEHGYDALIIWEHELSNDNIENKILEFDKKWEV